jgi:hypothetical protein
MLELGNDSTNDRRSNVPSYLVWRNLGEPNLRFLVCANTSQRPVHPFWIIRQIRISFLNKPGVLDPFFVHHRILSPSEGNYWPSLHHQRSYDPLSSEPQEHSFLCLHSPAMIPSLPCGRAVHETSDRCQVSKKEISDWPNSCTKRNLSRYGVWYPPRSRSERVYQSS